MQACSIWHCRNLHHAMLLWSSGIVSRHFWSPSSTRTCIHLTFVMHTDMDLAIICYLGGFKDVASMMLRLRLSCCSGCCKLTMITMMMTMMMPTISLYNNSEYFWNIFHASIINYALSLQVACQYHSKWSCSIINFNFLSSKNVSNLVAVSL